MGQAARALVGLWLAVFLAGCSALPPLPTIPPGWTVTPSLSPTAVHSPTPSPTPTPTPIARIQSGDQALFYGDYETARAQFTAAYRETSDPPLRADALWGLARTEFEDGFYNAALAALLQLVNDHSDSPRVAPAHFLLGRTYAALGRPVEAAAAYDTYLTLRPGVIDAYVHELRGDAFYEAGNFAEALSAYSAALASPRLDDGLLLQVRSAEIRAEIGDYANALAMYDQITASTTNPYILAQVDYRAGQALIAIGQVAEGQARYLHAVETYQDAYYSYLALVELVNAGAPVSELDRAIVDYNAGQYAVALAALDRFLAATPEHDGTASYFRAMTLLQLGRYEEALAEFNSFIDRYSANSYWPDAWDQKATIQWLELGDYSGAATTLQNFVGLMPTHSRSPEFLFYAGRILERGDHLAEAAAVWQRVADDFPGSALASQAIFLAGISRYRLGDYFRALSDFNRSLALSLQPEDQARAYLWIGKAQQKLDAETAAFEAWRLAQAIDPNGYYSERARDLLTGRAPLAPPATYDLKFDLAAERAAAAGWLRVTFNLPPETDLSAPGLLLQDARLQRGSELWYLGMHDEARREFENLRQAVSADAADSFRLANYLYDLGMYYPAIQAARQVLSLAGMESQHDSLMAPAYFSHLRYGPYYADIIAPAAQANGLHPLFLLAVARHESLFDRDIISTAGARGLMQIMPSTGASLAKQYGWPVAFSEDDLYRPNVSITLGAYYLASNRDLLGGDLYAALAAYNGGPGNAVQWKGLGGNDPDLLLEVIRFQQTRDYIRAVYENYAVYRALYSQTP